MPPDDRTGADAVRRFNEQPPWGPIPSMLGVEMVEIERDVVRGRIEVTERLLAGTGYLWAPVVVGLADALCAAGTGASLPEGATFTTIELKTNFLGTAREGRISTEATNVHAGRTTQVWDAVVRSEERTLALFRCTQSVLWPR